MFFRNSFGQGWVDGLGDESIPRRIAPYVRDFTALAKSSVLAITRSGYAAGPTPQPAFAELVGRITELVPVARAGAYVKENRAFAAGVAAALSADIDFYCGTPPRPHHLMEAALAVSLVAASLSEADAAKALLIGETERLQGKIQASA